MQLLNKQFSSFPYRAVS